MLSIEAEGKHVYGKDTSRKEFSGKVWISTSYLKEILFGLLGFIQCVRTFVFIYLLQVMLCIFL